jgi:hypothetical protein
MPNQMLPPLDRPNWVRQCLRRMGARAERRLPEGRRAAVGGGGWRRVAATTPGPENLKSATWQLAVDLPLETETMASRLYAVERVPSEGRGRPAQFIPVRFVFFNKLTKDDRLLVAFDALVLSEVLGREVSMGKIVHGDDDATLTVKTSVLAGEVRKRIEKMSPVLSDPTPPDLVLNRHCA